MDGLEEIGHALQGNQSLEKLNLCNCFSGTNVCSVLSDILLTNKSLKEVRFLYNRVSDKGLTGTIFYVL